MTAKKAKQPPPRRETRYSYNDPSPATDIAATLRQSVSRNQATEALADIFNADEATQLGLLKALAKQRDIDAADVLLRHARTGSQKDVRKEAAAR